MKNCFLIYEKVIKCTVVVIFSNVGFSFGLINCWMLLGLFTFGSKHIYVTKRHFAVKVQENLSGKSAIYEHISSCKDCHSCCISNLYTSAQANTDFEAKMKETLYIYKLYTKIKQPNVSLWFII